MTMPIYGKVIANTTYYYYYADCYMQTKYIENYCTSVYEHHYTVFYIKIAIFLLFQLFDY